MRLSLLVLGALLRSTNAEEAFEWAGIFAVSSASHTWSMQKVDGSYADQTMQLVLIPTTNLVEAEMHTLESTAETLFAGACTVVEDTESMTPAPGGSCFELHVGSGDDSTFTIVTAGLSGLAMYAEHVPTEFERTKHYFYDSAGTDIEPLAQEGAGGDHADHDHGGSDHAELSGDSSFEWAGTFATPNAAYKWIAEKVVCHYAGGTQALAALPRKPW